MTLVYGLAALWVVSAAYTVYCFRQAELVDQRMKAKKDQ
jgi:hypothetical protein